jgi:hypothetical protein
MITSSMPSTDSALACEVMANSQSPTQDRLWDPFSFELQLMSESVSSRCLLMKKQISIMHRYFCREFAFIQNDQV